MSFYPKTNNLNKITPNPINNLYHSNPLPAPSHNENNINHQDTQPHNYLAYRPGRI